jgi:hypothetical protein
VSEHKQAFLPTRRSLRLILGAIILFASYGLGGFSRSDFLQTSVALVRIELDSQAALDDLAASGLLVYAQFYTQQGGSFLLAPTDAGLQQDLVKRGYPVRILDADMQGKEYYLLSGLEEDVRQAGILVNLLLVEGRQAVACVSPEQVQELAYLGIKSMPLRPYNLVETVPQPPPQLPDTVTPSPLVQEMIDQVETSTLYDYVGDLSGEWEVIVSGNPYTIASRYTLSESAIKKATRFAYDHFSSLGLNTDFYYYGATEGRRIVIAEQGGQAQAGRIFLLTAHLDSIALNGDPSVKAPGADDNASGSAAVMQIADIFNPYDFDCTLRYVLFTGEEQGLWGSWSYATYLNQQGENIEGVLNLDMLAYNTPGSAKTIELHTRLANSGDLAIANLFSNVNSAYNIGLTPLILQDGEAFSDHYPFWQRGFPAILGIEDWSDHTPYYHTTYDRLASLDMDYYTRFAKAALGTFAHMGCLLEGKLSGTVREAGTNQPISGAKVELLQGGQVLRSTITQGDGSYQLGLIPGTYDVRFTALDHLGETVPDVQVDQGQNRLLDASLQPCIFAKEVSFSFDPFRPQVDESVAFSAQVGAGETPITYTWDFDDGQNASGQSVTHAFTAQGGYLVELTANNACGVPASTTRFVPVDMELFYLPLIYSAGPN